MRLKLNKYAFLVFIIALLVYTITLCPGISLGDSGEFIAVAHTLGIAHPSGYPTYTLLGKFFTFLPFGSIALKVNFMSAFFAALAIAVLYLLLKKITNNNLFSLFTALFFAFTPTFWSQSTIAEVHSFHVFLFILSSYLIILWHENQQIKFLYFFAFAYGLSLTNHITSVLFMPAFAYLILKRIKTISTKQIIITILIFLIALTPYIYLPLRSSTNPALDWGNPERLDTFIFHITGQQYSDRMFTFSLDNFFKFFAFIFLQFNIFFSFAILGVMNLKKIKSKYIIFLILSSIFLFLFTVTYDIGDIALYYMPIYLFISILIGLGALLITDQFKNRFVKTIILLFILILFLTTTAFIFNDNLTHKQDHYDALKYSNTMEKTLKKEASLIWILGNETDFLKNVLLYDKHVKNKQYIQNKIIAAPVMIMHPETRIQIKNKNPSIIYNYPIITPLEFQKNKDNIEEFFSERFLNQFILDNKISVYIIKGNISEPIIKEIN